MNRAEFMKELEERLVNVPEEERKEALQYYNDYFEDAGIENEAAVIAELESPERVANSIQLDIRNNDRGEFTERGFQTGDEAKPYEVIKSQEKESEKSTSSSKNAAVENSEDYEPVRKNGLSPLAIILLCIFAIPIGIPLISVLFGIFIGIGAAIFGLVCGFGIATVACIISGFVVFLIGITKVIVFPFAGILFIGGGLIVFGIGLLFALLTGLFAKMIPALCRAFVSLCKAPFRRGSVAA